MPSTTRTGHSDGTGERSGATTGASAAASAGDWKARWQDPATRDPFRAELVARIPRWYSPWAHVVFPSACCIAVIVAMIATLRDVRPLELLTVPVVLLVSNAVEWRLHKYVLHRKFPFFGVIYQRHTPEHHRVFVLGDMEIRSHREFKLVLIPAVGVLGILLMDLPPALAIWHLLGWHNVACLFLATSALYVSSYELLHLCYHLPAESFIGRRRFIRWLARHHAIHHAPPLMRAWNFNVTLPLWDWVRGSIYRGPLPPSHDTTEPST